MAIRFDKIEITGSGGNHQYPEISNPSGQLIQIQTSTGYVRLGSDNSSYAHLITDRPTLYINTGIQVDSGRVESYDENLVLRRGSAGHTITIGTGDIKTSANLQILKDNPVLILNETTAANDNERVAYLSFQHDGTEEAYLGWGSASNTNFTIQNTTGSIIFANSSNRLSISGDVEVVGSTDLCIPTGRRFRLDGAGGHTYIMEEGDNNMKFYVGGSEHMGVGGGDVFIRKPMQIDSFIYHIDNTGTSIKFEQNKIVFRTNNSIAAEIDTDQTLIAEKSVTVGFQNTASSTANIEHVLRVKGKNNYSDGTNWYGDYGQIILHSTTNMTSSARRILITNAYKNNRFAIIRSAAADADPVTDSTGSGVNVGAVNLDFNNGGFATFHDDVRIDGSDLYFNSSSAFNIRGFGDHPVITGVNGATYLYVGGSTSLAASLQSGRIILATGLAYGAVNNFTTIIDGSTGAISDVPSIACLGTIASSGSGSLGRLSGAQGLFGTTFMQTSNSLATYGSSGSSVGIALALDGNGANPALEVSPGTDLASNLVTITKPYQDQLKKLITASVSNSYVRIFTVGMLDTQTTANQLASMVRVSATAHGNSHVGNFTALVMVNHYQDVIVRSYNSMYTQITIKVESDNNGQYTCSIKTNSSNAATYCFTVEAFSSEVSITKNPSSSVSTNTVHEHTCEVGGFHMSNTGGTLTMRNGGNFVNTGTANFQGSFTNSILIDYTGSDSNNNDAGLKIMNDGSDWGAYIRKDSNANFGLRIDSGGGNAITVYSTTGGSTKTFNVNGSTGETDTGHLTVTTASGEITVGASNTSGAHIYTDRPRFFFNKTVRPLTGIFASYQNDLKLQRDENSSHQMTLDNTGTGTFTGDVVAYSDARLKEDVKTLDGSKVYDMRGVSFKRIDTGKEGSGVIAQEIQKVAPELITETDNHLGVAYGNITGYLIEAIKDLKQEVEELKKQINK